MIFLARGRNKGFYVDMDKVQLENAIRKLDIFHLEKRDNVKKIIRRTAKDIQETAQVLVPVGEGETKYSIKPKYFEGGLASTVGPRLPDGWKAHFWEFGHYNTWSKKEVPARPFMTPAAEIHRPKYLQKLKKEMRDV